MQIALRLDGMVHQYGESIGTPAACTLVTLTPAQETAFGTALQTAEKGITFIGGVFTPVRKTQAERDAETAAAVATAGKAQALDDLIAQYRSKRVIEVLTGQKL